MNSLPPRPVRRTYSPQFKAELVAQCLEGNVALASLAIDHGMNPNVLHRWVTEHERYGKHTLQNDGVALPVQTVDVTPANWFAVKPLPVVDSGQVMPPALPAAQAPDPIQANKTIEVALAVRGLTMTVHWPCEDHKGLACFARELLV
ncbi:transposase [Allopusillimonas ginsengisoli]|nr:transposase [Allopusillimonas ginsengisoli]TEA69319.1 transposase [Allopusillimonas ginsengisoli]